MSPFLQSLGLLITFFGAWNLLVAIWLWAPRWLGQSVLVFSDNPVTVAALCSGRVQDPVLRGVLREMWMLAALIDVDLPVRHLPGERTCMGTADALSRESFQARAAEVADVFRSGPTEVEVCVPDSLLGPPACI